MMKIAFDLISDLHIETWDTEFEWSGQATSPICVVAGDVARDPTVLKTTLEKISKCYKLTIFIDGNEEHKHNWDDLAHGPERIHEIVNSVDGCVYLHDNVVVYNGVAFLGTNGWWDWNFDPSIDTYQSFKWFCDQYKCNEIVPYIIDGLATSEAEYLCRSVSRLQMHPDIKEIVIVTHTIPMFKLVEHDTLLDGTYRMNIMGNTRLQNIFSADTENKIKTWCIGHYHGVIDSVIDGVRYVNNCRGRGDTEFRQVAYYPRRVEL